MLAIEMLWTSRPVNWVLHKRLPCPSPTPPNLSYLLSKAETDVTESFRSFMQMSPCSAQDLPSFPDCSPVETSPVPIGLTSPHNCWPTLLCDCITPSRDLLMTFVGLWAKLASGQKQHLVHSFRGVSTMGGGAPQLQEGDVQRVADRKQRTSGNGAL